MKKRKITRMTLDELAKKIPVLTEQESSKILAGAWYYYPNGTFFMSAGTSDNIYVYENGNSVLLSEASHSAIRNVLGQLSQQIMGYSGIIELASSGSVTAGFDRHGSLWFNLADTATINNYYNLRSTLYHESSHYDDYTGSGAIIDGNEGEIRAYERQVSSPDYAMTSYEYKISVARGWFIATGSDPLQKSDIAYACGVNITDI